MAFTTLKYGCARRGKVPDDDETDFKLITLLYPHQHTVHAQVYTRTSTDPPTPTH